MRKINAVILAAIFAAAALSVPSAAAAEIPVLSDDFYILNKAEHLIWYANEINGGKVHIKARLAADIDLNGKRLRPIGENPNSPFNGIFDGDGHTVYNFANAESELSAGFFGFIGYDGVVQNVTFRGTDIFIPNGSVTHAGTIAADNHGLINNCRVADCVVTAGSEPAAEPLSIGGAVGANIDGIIIGLTVEDCTVRSAVPYAERFIAVGGAVGTAVANTKESGILQGVRSARNTIGVFAESDDAMVYAGLVTGLSNGSIAKSCTVEGGRLAVPSFDGEGAALGGIVGSAMPDTYLENCSVILNAKLSATGGKTPVLVGGIAGEFIAASANGCSVDGVTAETRPALANNVGGIAGNLAGSVLRNCYVAEATLPDGTVGMTTVGAIAGMAVSAELFEGTKETVLENCAFSEPIAGGVAVGISDGGEHHTAEPVKVRQFSAAETEPYGGEANSLPESADLTESADINAAVPAETSGL